VTFGIRTIDGTAKNPSEYTKMDDVVTMKKRETEKTI
jgi:hypothetical protein